LTGTPLIMDGDPTYMSIYANDGDVVLAGVVTLDGSSAFVASYGVTGDLTVTGPVLLDGGPAYVSSYGLSGDVAVTSGGGSLQVNDSFSVDGELSTNWSNAASPPSAHITCTSGEAHSITGAVGAYALWTNDTFGNNQFSQAKVTGHYENQINGVMVRTTGDYTGYATQPGISGYLLWKQQYENEDYDLEEGILLIKAVDGVLTELDLHIGVIPTDLRLEANGTTISGYYSIDNGTTWELAVTVTDSTFPSGNVGFFVGGAFSSVTEWSGGDL